MDTQHAYLVRTQYLPVALAKAYAKQCNLPNDSDDVRVYRSNWGRQIKLLIDNKTIVEKDSHGLPLMDCPPLTGFIDLHDICAYGEANRIPSIPPAAVTLAEAMEFIEPGEVLSQVAPAPAEAMPKAAPVANAPAQGNTTKTRRSDTITPVITLAQSKCADPNDTSQVWAQMQVLAQREQAPFLASTSEGLKYHKKGGDAYFTRNALDKRLHPNKRGMPVKRR